MGRAEIKRLVQESGLADRIGKKEGANEFQLNKERYYSWDDEFTQKVIDIFNQTQDFQATADALGISRQNIHMGFKRKNVEIVRVARLKTPSKFIAFPGQKTF